ncbi:GNAT family N-acetyltransferase [Streptomyces sp. NBC_01497]|uniref:GNAT family N-acetyltransferase n=1 Tax=Streptomyces sp. NBC_01497 TaxID=2903885 RepID=UPI002E30F1CE|nr:GNAT family N-acetyltransferase [Streptomyces sp. NBC_01497]
MTRPDPDPSRGADSGPGPGSSTVTGLPEPPSAPLLPPLPPRFPGPDEPVRVAGEGLVLREWTRADVPAMTALFDDPDVARFTPLASPFDEAAARAYLTRGEEARAEGHKVQWAVTTDGDTPLGEVLLFTTPENRFDIEAGYVIGPRHRGQGLAVRALRIVTAYAYDTLGARRVLLRIVAENAASAAVARSAGFGRADLPPIRSGEALLDTWQHGGVPDDGRA